MTNLRNKKGNKFMSAEYEVKPEVKTGIISSEAILARQRQIEDAFRGNSWSEVAKLRAAYQDIAAELSK